MAGRPFGVPHEGSGTLIVLQSIPLQDPHSFSSFHSVNKSLHPVHFRATSENKNYELGVKNWDKQQETKNFMSSGNNTLLVKTMKQYVSTKHIQNSF